MIFALPRLFKNALMPSLIMIMTGFTAHMTKPMKASPTSGKMSTGFMPSSACGMCSHTFSNHNMK